MSPILANIRQKTESQLLLDSDTEPISKNETQLQNSILFDMETQPLKINPTNVLDMETQPLKINPTNVLDMETQAIVNAGSSSISMTTQDQNALLDFETQAVIQDHTEIKNDTYDNTKVIFLKEVSSYFLPLCSFIL